MNHPFAPPGSPRDEPPGGDSRIGESSPRVDHSVPTGPPPTPSVVMPNAILPSRGPRRRAGIVAIVVVACLLFAAGAFVAGRATSDDSPAAATSGPAPAVPSPGATGATPGTSATLGSGAPQTTDTTGGSSVIPVAPVDEDTPVTARTVVGSDTDAVDVSAVVASLSERVVKVSVDVDSASGTGSGVGTGIIVTSDGQVLTNAHVVVDATAIRLLMPGATEPVDASLVGIDVGNDLALLTTDATDLPAITFANSDDVQVGDPVVAMGYALDLEGDASVTSGIISALNRSMVTEDGALNNLLQTDEAISSGNSGGPLVNAAGQLIGINTAVAISDATRAANNIGFAIASNEVQRILDRLRESPNATSRRQGYLGIGVEARQDGGRGAIVSEVQPDSPAADLGLHVGDIIDSVDGEAIDGQAGLIAAIRDHTAGDTVSIEYHRDGKQTRGDVTLASRPGG